MINRLSSKVRSQAKRVLIGDQYPTARVVELNDITSVFEVTNPVEDHRAANFGGESEQLKQFLETVRNGDIVWDVGANIGLFSIFASRKGADVTAFEPDPEFAHRIRRNIELNGQDINIRQFALSDEDGAATLYTDGVDGMSPGLTAKKKKTRDEITIETRRADCLDSGNPDVLKIDVEGAEAKVLRGMNNTLNSARTIFIEIHPKMLRRFGDSVDDVTQSLADAGFEQRFSRDRNEQTHYIFDR